MRTLKLKIPHTEQLDALNAASASVWGECLNFKSVWDYAHGYRTTGRIDKQCELWMDKQLSKSHPLHSQSIQAVRERYFKNRKAYRALRRNGNHTTAKPPHKSKRFQTTTWKKSAIRFKETLLGKVVRLSNGKGNHPPLQIQLPKSFNLSIVSDIVIVNLVYTHGHYELHFVYNTEKTDASKANGVAGVDIGEIHPIVSHDGQNTLIFNGRYIRSLYRLRNKALASMNAKIDRCQRHSKRWWHLVRRKWKRIRKIDHQIKDALHKHTTTFVKYCSESGIGTIAIGDLTGIRENIDYGKRANQKLHQWAFGKVRELITYKAKAVGIKVELIDEAYTSQTCPNCGNRKKPHTRNYHCAPCGFKYHRDGVGAINIRQKYLGHFGVPVGADMGNQTMKMTPPVGFRLEVRCCSA
ncbi:MAG: transposase [Candidatus Poribacteria bacterium]|nr:transposase [Candidatus Poribacteria bacterium]